MEERLIKIAGCKACAAETGLADRLYVGSEYYAKDVGISMSKC
jgi:hypothetical protein